MGHKFKSGDMVFWKGTSFTVEILETCITYDDFGHGGDYGYMVQDSGWPEPEPRAEKAFMGYEENLAYVEKLFNQAVDSFVAAGDTLNERTHTRNAVIAKEGRVAP